LSEFSDVTSFQKLKIDSELDNASDENDKIDFEIDDIESL
jgi:hypothetical protein